VVNGRYGLHVVTLVPITLVPYSPDGLPTIGVVLPLDGPHWLPVRAGDFSPGQHSRAEEAEVHFISGDHQSSGRGMFWAWINGSAHLLSHDTGSPWTFHTKSFREAAGESTKVRYVCTRWLSCRGFFDKTGTSREVRVYEFLFHLWDEGQEY